MPVDQLLSGSLDEAARQRFEAAWFAGQPEPLASLLPSPDDPGYLRTLEELVLIEMEFAWNPPEGPGRPQPPFVEA